jgi:hypothetical protein
MEITPVARRSQADACGLPEHGSSSDAHDSSLHGRRVGEHAQGWAASESSSPTSTGAAMPILLTALVVAILDGLFPIVVNWHRLHGATPRRVMQSVAAGVLGRASFDGGVPTALLGVALHCTIALIWTAVYALVVRRLAVARRLAGTTAGTVVAGAIYGAVIWCSMDFVVIPLSRATFTPVSNPAFWQQLVWHMVGVGPTIVWFTERVFGRAARGATAASLNERPASSPA